VFPQIYLRKNIFVKNLERISPAVDKLDGGREGGRKEGRKSGNVFYSVM
jgi:hypothetical protein